MLPQRTSWCVISAADVLWDVCQQYEDALCIPFKHGSYTEAQQRQVTSGKTRYKLSSLKARAGLIYLRHPKLKSVVCSTIPPPPLASCCSEHASKRPPCKLLSAQSAEHCHPPPVLAFRWMKSPRPELSLCICITDTHGQSKQGNFNNIPLFQGGPHRAFPHNILWGKESFPWTSVRTIRLCSPFQVCIGLQWTWKPAALLIQGIQWAGVCMAMGKGEVLLNIPPLPIQNHV